MPTRRPLMTGRVRWPALALAWGLTLAAAPARAADPVTDAVQAAYVPYRTALFRTNAGAQAESVQAMDAARRAWQGVAARFAQARPAPYDRDDAFDATLGQVGQVYERAAAQVTAGRLAEAHETLEAVRDLLAELRRRNGVIVYSDHMNAYHAEMEHLIEAGPGGLGTPQGHMRLMARAGVLEYLAARLRTEAAPALAADPEFTPLARAVEASVQSLQRALLAQDADAVRAALGGLKGPYSRLFLRFG